jgi:hypothetical protein
MMVRSPQVTPPGGGEITSQQVRCRLQHARLIIAAQRVHFCGFSEGHIAVTLLQRIARGSDVTDALFLNRE